MNYCKKCVYPEVSVNLNINDEGVCSACITSRKFKNTSINFWEKRKNIFLKILREANKKNKSNYDCLIPVSGGKDSYYQTHLIVKKFGLKPLLVTYHGNNYLPEGDLNRDKMRHNFDADHIVWGPSVSVLKKLNRLGFKKMGDMNWHAHCGIKTSPISIAVKFKIPLIIWGEIEWDISGMFDPEDFVEFSARVRHEHDLRGFEWYDFINNSKEDKISEKDMIWAKYPSDKEILETKVKGIYVGNFFPWEANKQATLMKKHYKWQEAKKSFERTYRAFSNLDDRYENGVHDLLKFIKFGYGRCSDHASKDIRNGILNRKQAINLVQKYDHVISSDLYHWLKYVDMKETEFWEIADTFRDPRVWKIEKNKWFKKTLWNTYESYGEVHLTKKQIYDYIKKQKKHF
jgi:hypothetical protein